MYQIGDRVVYGIHGVCRVAALEKQIVNRKTVTYLVLEPLGQEGSRYLIPTSSEAAMSRLRPMLTPEEMNSLLASDQIRQTVWIREENARKQTYRDLMGSGDRASLMGMVHSLYVHRRNQAAAGKKVHLADENFLRDAEKLLASEIAAVMELSPEDARSYLRKKLKAE